MLYSTKKMKKTNKWSVVSSGIRVPTVALSEKIGLTCWAIPWSRTSPRSRLEADLFKYVNEYGEARLQPLGRFVCAPPLPHHLVSTPSACWRHKHWTCGWKEVPPAWLIAEPLFTDSSTNKVFTYHQVQKQDVWLHFVEAMEKKVEDHKVLCSTIPRVNKVIKSIGSFQMGV